MDEMNYVMIYVYYVIEDWFCMVYELLPSP